MAITEGVVGGILPSDGSTTPKFTHGYYIDAESKIYYPRLDNVTAKNVRVALYDATGAALLVADDAAFTPGTNRVLPIGAFADETGPDSVDEGDVGIPRMTLTRILRVVPSLHDGTSEGGVSARAALTTSGGPASGVVAVAGQAYDTVGGTWRTPYAARGIAAGDNGAQTGRVHNSLYNGATFDPQLGNTEGTVLASAARTANTSSTTQTNGNLRGVLLTLNVTAKAGATTLDIRFVPVNPITAASAGTSFASGAFAAAAGSSYKFWICPGVLNADAFSATTDVLKAGFVPRSWMVTVVHSDADSITYSLAYQLIV